MLINDDCLSALKSIEDNSIDSLITDPPAGISFMGKDWDKDKGGRDQWIAWMTEIMAECLRVLKPGAHGLVWAIPRTSHWTATALEDAGFEVRDVVTHLFGSGFPKSSDISKQLDKQTRNEWLKIAESLDSVSVYDIVRAWISLSNYAKLAQPQSEKNAIETGTNTAEKGFVLEFVLALTNLEKSIVDAIIAELISSEVPPTLEAKVGFSVQKSADGNITMLSVPAWFVEKLYGSQGHSPSTMVSTVQWDAKVSPSENFKDLTKAEEALKTWLGRKPSSSKLATNVLCAALTENLKLTILNQSKTFLNLDTNFQTDFVSAITVTITESTAENLISSMVATLKSKAIDKAAGAERELGPTVGELNGRNTENHKKTHEILAQVNGWDKQTSLPATDAAKQWQGWGTALKPSNERWILCRKPISSEKLLEKTDTFNAQEWGETFLSIEKLWHNILNAILNDGSKSTIKTVSDLITELRTLKYLILGLMQVTTTPVEIPVNGGALLASDVIKWLKDALGISNDLSTISAQENVTNLADISAKLIKQWQKQDGEPNLAPFAEDYILVRKPISEKNIAENVLKWGVGGINIDASRIGTDTIQISKGRGFANKGIYEGGLNDTTANTSHQGRFPANLIFSHNSDCGMIGTYNVCTEDCPVRLLDEQSGNLGNNGRKKGSMIDSDQGGTPFGNNSRPAIPYFDTAGASRFFYVAKASKRERNEGLEGMPVKQTTGGGGLTECGDKFGSIKAPAQNFHPTVKPQKLMEYLIRMITPANGIVLDPFMGSGSTGVAAKKLGFGFIGIEKEAEYYEIATRRIG